MKTLMDWFQVKKKYRTDGDLGVEVEVEGRRLPSDLKYWRREEDGSLRGEETAEYVFNRPLSVKDAEHAFDELDYAYVSNKTVVDDSVRAGVHVHINVQGLSLIQLFNFITIYLVLEEVLVDHCGEGRQGNLFCLRAMDAGFLVQAIRKAVVKGDFMSLYRDDLRYSSMNVKSLSQYGSLEFRAMRGTRDMSRISDWAKLLLNLRDVATGYNCPQSVIRGFSEAEADSFMRRCLGDYAQYFIDQPDSAKKVRAGMRRAQDLAFCVDWETFRERPVKNINGVLFYADEDFNHEPIEDV